MQTFRNVDNDVVDAATVKRIEMTPTTKSLPPGPIPPPSHPPPPPSPPHPLYNVVTESGSLQHCSVLATVEQTCATEQITLMEIQGKQLETQGKYLETQNKNLETKGKYLETQNKNLETKGKYLETQNKNLEKKGKYLEMNLETQQKCLETQQRTIVSPESEAEQETISHPRLIAAIQDSQMTIAHKHKLDFEANVQTVDGKDEPLACFQGWETSQKDVSLLSVPYMDPVEVVICDSKGGVFYSSTHDFGFAIPEGAIPEGDSINIEVGVTLTGPFDFPQGSKPLSPIVKLCVQQQPNFQFLRPVEVVLPHYLDLSSEEDDSSELQLGFWKAGHTLNDNQLYKFQQIDLSNTHFEHEYGILQTNHFCFLCIGEASGVTRETTAEASFYLLGYQIMLNPTEWRVYFCVAYFLATCVKVCCMNHVVCNALTCALNLSLVFVVILCRP